MTQLEQKLSEHNAAMAEVDPSDRAKMTDMAYAYDAVQQEMQEAINQWELAVETLDRLESNG